MRILIAEDDSILADGLTRSLRQSGYAVDHVRNGVEADTALSMQAFDLLILDLGLPKMSGLDVLRRLRARNSNLPVLILTAADSVDERVKGLDLGADDYMAKPFALNELEARVRALTRRGAGGGPTVVRHGSLSFDQVGRIAYANDRVLELSARELGLLEVLLQRIGRLVSKEQLVDHLCEWGEEVSNNAIEVYVHRLRKKIEPSGVRITTVRGLGYCLEKAAPAANDAPAAAAPQPAASAASPSLRRARASERPMATPVRSPHAARGPADAASDADAARDARYENPFAPPDETDAAEGPRPRSLFGEILDWMLAPLLLLWPMSIAVTYLVAKTIANGPFDRALETDAYVLARQITPVNGVAELKLPQATLDFLRADNVDSLYFQVLGTRGELVAGEADLPLPRDDDRPSPGVVVFRDDMLRGNDVRVAYTTVALPGATGSQPVLVQVGETLDKRNALANDIIKGVILPQFVILPLAILLVWFGLSRGLAPLTALQAHIRNRRPDDLSPVEAKRAPPEIEPLVTSFNDLLARLEQNITLQKRFIADAAHQMKTPLAGLRTQAEFALRHEVPDDVARSLEQIATSSEQAARLVTQLLALARAENRATGLTFEPVEIATLARQAVRDWVQAALAKQMDLGYEGPDAAAGPLRIDGHPVMLREMLGNLIDNAIRYTPAGGRITVRVRADRAARVVHVEVEDTGPGIPANERERVVERFYRILGREGDGSGLGLAIVREIVAQHGGTLTIDDNVYQTSPRLAGTLVRVSLGLRPAAPE